MFQLAAVAQTVAPWWFPSETVQLAVVAGGGGVMSAVIMAVVTYVVATRQKRADWQREDEVARRTEQVRIKEEERAATLLATNKQIAEQTAKVTSKLDVIHALVDGGVTATLQTLLDSLRAQLVLLKKVPDHEKDTDEAIAVMEERIKGLAATVDERRRIEKLSTATRAQQVEERANDKH
jgi:hypothetical protein